MEVLLRGDKIMMILLKRAALLLKRAAHQMMSITLLQHHMSPQQVEVEGEHVDVDEAMAQLEVLLVQQALTL